MINKKTQRKRFINFIMTYANDEIETKQDIKNIVSMSNKELLKNIQSIKQYYKTELNIII